MKVSKMRVLSLLLALVMIVGSVPFNAFAAVDYDETVDDYYNVISKTDYELAPGITESEIILNNDAGSHRQVAHVVEVDIDNPYTKVIPSYKGMAEGLEAQDYGVQIMSEQAAYAEANGYGNVVAAMNLSLSWYDSTYYQENPELVGEPLGYMILDGVQYTNSQGQSTGAQTCLVINFDEKDGEARPDDIPKTEIRSTSSAITGWEEQVIPANFGFLVKDGVNQYAENHTTDPASRSFVGIKENGDIVIVMNDGRQSPYSVGFNSYEMAQFMISLGCVQAVNGDGGGSSAFLSQRPGEELKINCSPSDGAERETTHGVLIISTAPATGEFVRASISSAEDYYTPGSSVQFSAIGSDLVGTAAAIPENAVWQLADASFGTIDENGLFVSNGTQGDVTVQLAVDGTVVGEDTIHIVMPDGLAFAQTNMIVPYGKTVDLGFSATYDNKNVVLKASDVVFTLSDDALGTISGFEFTAAEEGTTVTSGTVSATVGELTVSANLSLGKGSEIVYDFEDQDLTGWTVDDGYGKYGPKGPNGSVTDENGNFWYNGQNELGSFNIVTAETGEVRNGEYALALHCDYTQIYETGYHGLVFRMPTIDCTDAVAIGMWLYVPEEAKHAELRLAVGGSYVTLFDNGQLMDLTEGWNYIKLDISEIATKTVTALNVQIDDRACSSTAAYYDYTTEANLNGKYVLYVDDITIDYSSAVDDREAPVFSEPVVLSVTGESSAVLSGQTVDYNTLTFEASVAEDTANTNATGLDASTAKAYIDGVEVEFVYNSGKFTITDAVLADGLHTVTFSICDKMGNPAHISGEIVVAANSGISTVEVVPQDPDADRLLIGSVYWLDVVATDIETIQEVEVVLDLNNASSWELEGMELAEGFTAAYSVQADDNIATITITRTGENAQTGEAVIASLPARTWVSTITECEGYEDQTPEVLWSRGIIWHKSMIVEQDRGVITYVDGTTSSFDSADLEVDTEIWFTYYSRKLVDGAVDYYAANTGWHTHTAEAIDDKAATCTESGYTGRTYCSGCESVVDWGTILPATGHNYVDVDGVLTCEGCGKLFNGELDGKTYIDGVVANGWINDTYYYIDGVMVTGQYYLDGVLYTFGTDGVYDADYLYTGFYETADGKLMYFVSNEFLTGYQYLMGEPYFFDANGYGFEGEYTMAGETCLFENGQYVSCSTADVLNAGLAGANATYVLYADGTFKLDGTGSTYSFTNHGTRPFISYSYKIKTFEIGAGITRIGSYFMCYSSVTTIKFAEGSNLQQIGTAAFYECYGLRTVELPSSVTYMSNMAFGKCENLTKLVMPENISSINANAFKKTPNVTLYVVDGSYAMEYAITYSIPYVTYTVETVREIVEVDGVLYYYEDGVKTYGGLIQLDGDYYYVRSSGELVVDRTYWVTKTNDLLPEGNYTFGADGKMVTDGSDSGDSGDSGDTGATDTGSIVDVDGTLYYYKDGAPYYAGLIQIDGDYYYVRSSGKLAVSTTYWITKTNDLLPVGNYTFGADGKMVTDGSDSGDSGDSGDTGATDTGSIVDVDGTLYYYKDGAPYYAGLIQIDGDYYYVRSSGKLAVSTTYWITKTNDLLPAGNYTFGADGKMITE